MAIPTFHAAGTASGSTGAPTPTMPTFSVGDFLLLVVESSSTQHIAAPTGWTELAGSPVDDGSGAAAGNPSLQCFYRIAQAGDTAPSVPDSGNHTAAQILSWSGNDTSSPFSGTNASSTAAASTSISQPGVTTADANCLVIYVVGHAIDSTGAKVSGQADASLSSVTERADFDTNSNQGGGFAVTEGGLATAGASGTMTATLAASSKKCYLTFAIKPPGGITVSAPLATGAGTAFVPTGSMTVDSTPLASGAGSGFVPTGALRGDAPEALGTGTGFIPSGSMTALAPEALGTGVAFVASIGGISLDAPLASGAGVAFIPSGSMVATAPEAAGTGVAFVPTGSMTENAPLAQGAGVGFPAKSNIAGAKLTRTFWRHPPVFSWTDKDGLL